jgi:hypothetical protein
VGPAEAGGAGVGLEAPHRLVAPFYVPVILLDIGYFCPSPRKGKISDC